MTIFMDATKQKYYDKSGAYLDKMQVASLVLFAWLIPIWASVFGAPIAFEIVGAIGWLITAAAWVYFAVRYVQTNRRW